MSTPEQPPLAHPGAAQPGSAQSGPGQPPGYGPPPGSGQSSAYGPLPGYGAAAPAYGPPPGYGAPPAYGWTAGVQTEGKAVAALVLAIASFVVFPLVPAIIALFLAGAARRDIDASAGRLTGEGLVTGARITAWINIGFCALVLVVLVGGFALFSVSSTSP